MVPVRLRQAIGSLCRPLPLRVNLELITAVIDHEGNYDDTGQNHCSDCKRGPDRQFRGSRTMTSHRHMLLQAGNVHSESRIPLVPGRYAGAARAHLGSTGDAFEKRGESRPRTAPARGTRQARNARSGTV